jgi:hypothetical protein
MNTSPSLIATCTFMSPRTSSALASISAWRSISRTVAAGSE